MKRLIIWGLLALFIIPIEAEARRGGSVPSGGGGGYVAPPEVTYRKRAVGAASDGLDAIKNFVLYANQGDKEKAKEALTSLNMAKTKCRENLLQLQLLEDSESVNKNEALAKAACLSPDKATNTTLGKLYKMENEVLLKDELASEMMKYFVRWETRWGLLLLMWVIGVLVAVLYHRMLKDYIPSDYPHRKHFRNSATFFGVVYTAIALIGYTVTLHNGWWSMLLFFDLLVIIGILYFPRFRERRGLT